MAEEAARPAPATDGRCADCGFDYDGVAATDVAALLRDAAQRFAQSLTATRGDVRARPQPQVWSPLEYGCHLRDVLLVQRERLLLARRVERPEMVSMGRDERAEHERYNDQEVEAVARQLVDAASLLAHALEYMPPDAWTRTVVYNYPARTERPLTWLAIHTLHEVQHHHLDITRRDDQLT